METTSDKKNLLGKKPRLIFAMDILPKPGRLRAVHCHEYCEITLIREGSGKIEADGEITEVSAGDVFICNPGVYHAEFMAPSDKRKITFLGIRLKLEGFAENCLLKNRYRIIRDKNCFDSLCECADIIISENAAKQPHYGAICEGLVNIFISVVLRHTCPDSEKILERKKTYLEVKNYLDQNFCKITSIEEVCDKLFLNKFYLSHLFKGTLGVPPLKYITAKKIELAKKLLLTTDESVKEIAITCGFGDVSYFCRVFKKSEKTSPSRFHGDTKKT